MSVVLFGYAVLASKDSLYQLRRLRIAIHATAFGLALFSLIYLKAPLSFITIGFCIWSSAAASVKLAKLEIRIESKCSKI